MDPEDDVEKIEGEQQVEVEGDKPVDGEAGAAEKVEGDAPAGEAGADGEAGEVVISLGGEAVAPEEDENAAPQWVRELRKSNREKDRRIRELEQKVATTPANAAPAAT